MNPELDFIQEAKAGGAEITGELEIAYRIARGTFIANYRHERKDDDDNLSRRNF